MKTTLRIAKLELSTLFYSPIAWFLLIAFLFQCGLAYINGIDHYVIEQGLGGVYLRRLIFLTEKVYVPPFGIFPGIVSSLYLYLPLLTMGLMSREVSSGTIRLLYSSPIRVREIVFGKFLAMMVYNLLLILALALVMAATVLTIQSADIGYLLASLLGIYLLLCAYAAIGLFMSCLTSYQVVAAVSTLVVLGALNYVGELWQGVDFIRDLTRFLSLSGRTNDMLHGLISTKDVLYFLIIIFLFLGFSIYKLQAGRESRPLVVRAGRYALLFLLAMTIGYLSSLPRLVGYFDATATKTHTLTAGTQRTLKEAGDGLLEVHSYINLLDRRYWYGTPEQRNADKQRWEPYLRFKPDIKFTYTYFYDSADNPRLYKDNRGLTLDQLADKYAKSFDADLTHFKTPKEIRATVDLRPELNRYVMQLQYRGRSTFLRLFNDMEVFPGEAETSAALKRLMQAKMPRIVFAEGALERSPFRSGDRDYKMMTNLVSFRYSLINQGFDVDTVSLDRDPIPADIAALVIADPRMDLSAVAMAKVRQYIADGGNLLIAGEPGKQAVLNPLLQPLGVQLMDGILVQPGRDYAPDLVLPWLTDTAAGLTKALHQQWDDSDRIAMSGTVGLHYRQDGPFSIQPLLMTDSRLAWNKKGRLVVDSGEVAFSGADGDERGAVATAVRMSRRINGKEQRIIVTGDADFMDNTELMRVNMTTANFAFNTALFSWLSYGQFPVDATRPKSPDHHFTVTDAGMKALRVVYLGVLPGLLLISAIILLLRRKRK